MPCLPPASRTFLLRPVVSSICLTCIFIHAKLHIICSIRISEHCFRHPYTILYSKFHAFELGSISFLAATLPVLRQKALRPAPLYHFSFGRHAHPPVRHFPGHTFAGIFLHQKTACPVWGTRFCAISFSFAWMGCRGSSSPRIPRHTCSAPRSYPGPRALSKTALPRQTGCS